MSFYQCPRCGKHHLLGDCKEQQPAAESVKPCPMCDEPDCIHWAHERIYDLERQLKEAKEELSSQREVIRKTIMPDHDFCFTQRDELFAEAREWKQKAEIFRNIAIRYVEADIWSSSKRPDTMKRAEQEVDAEMERIREQKSPRQK